MNTYSITLAFTRPDILDFSLKRYYETAEAPTKHYILDQHYPKTGSIEIEMIAQKYGCLLLDAGKNLGLHHGFNYICDFIQKTTEVKPDDLIIAYDHDVNPITNHWDRALKEVMENQTIGWANLRLPQFEWEIDNKTEIKQMGNTSYIITQKPTTNSISAFRWDFLRRAGGLREPNAWYGHLEATMWQDLIDQGYHRVVLPDFYEHPTPELLHDKMYTKYKWALAHEYSTTDDYETWLNKQVKLL